MNLSEIHANYPKATVVTHTDLDGYGAGSILYKVLLILGYQKDEITVIHKEPAEEFVPDYEPHHLYMISDLGLSNPTNISKIRELYTYYLDREVLLFYFDHHDSTITAMNRDKYNVLEYIPGIRNVEACATILCWLFYQWFYCQWTSTDGNFDLDRFIGEIDCYNIKIPSEDLKMNENGLSGPYLVPEFSEMTGVKRIPNSLLYTDDYDRFVNKYENSQYFNNAFWNCPDLPKDITADYWQKFYSHTTDENSHSTASTAGLITQSLVDFGKVASAWERHLAYKKILDDGFIASLNPADVNNLKGIVPDEWVDHLDEIRFLVCPGIDINLRLLMNEEIEAAYPYMIKYNDLGDRQRATVYFTEKKEGINASQLCQLYGGGGHPGCGGFTLNRIPFIRIHTFDEMREADPDNDLLIQLKKLQTKNAENLTPRLSAMLIQYMK